VISMICKVDELKDKQIVNVKNGAVIGNVSDIEINTDSGNITSLIIYGKNHFLGLFGRDNDIVIPWEEIEVIGAETILVKSDKMIF